MVKNCIFCKIVNKKLSAHIIWEDEKHIAFLTPYPNTEGFTVVATKEHKSSYAFDNDEVTLNGIIKATKQVAKKIDRAYDDVGRCGMFFEGWGVDHLHAKLFPMHGTGKMDNWAMIEENLPNIYFDTYPGYLSSHNGKKVDDVVLKKVAERIRKA